MVISHIVASLDPRHGGPSNAVRALAEAQAAHGDTVGLFTAGARARQELAGHLTVQTLSRGWPARICPVPGLAARVRAFNPEIVHAHGLWLRPLHHARIAAQRSGVPFVVSPRGMMSPWAWRHHRLRKIIASRFIHPRAFDAVDGWHATSEQEARDIQALGFKQPIAVAPIGVAVPAEDELAAARQHWHEACPESRERRTALFYSRFHAKKRVLELIDLWNDHAPRDWLLLLVGIPEQYSVEELRNYIYRSGASDRIDVFDGADRPAPYAVASLCLLPSHSENFGLVVAEALAAGVPALVTDSTPWQGLNTERAGWCVPWSEYAATLKTALSEPPPVLAARALRARAWAGRAFAWAESARLLGSFYRQLRERGA